MSGAAIVVICMVELFVADFLFARSGLVRHTYRAALASCFFWEGRAGGGV